MAIDERNVLNAKIARQLYLDTTNPAAEAEDWQTVVAEVRQAALEALDASDDLRDIASALNDSGKHMLVFRHLLAPPKSQDQFKLLCPEWSKATEKSGSPVKSSASNKIAETVQVWIDNSLVPWAETRTNPTDAQKALVVERVVSFIAPKKVDTAKRNRLSSQQEREVVDLLKGLGWEQLPSKLIDTRAAVDPKCFMNKTRFATATTTAQEVDIACGLSDSYVAAMECKVTNDETNSVKRINDILKKANAWKAHWGSFVKTTALLQGVIKPVDVQRLSDEGVHVFWSHNLQEFEEWLEDQT
jgi:hypothetical protein